MGEHLVEMTAKRVLKDLKENHPVSARVGDTTYNLVAGEDGYKILALREGKQTELIRATNNEFSLEDLISLFNELTGYKKIIDKTLYRIDEKEVLQKIGVLVKMLRNNKTMTVKFDDGKEATIYPYKDPTSGIASNLAIGIRIYLPGSPEGETILFSEHPNKHKAYSIAADSFIRGVLSYIDEGHKILGIKK